MFSELSKSMLWLKTRHFKQKRCSLTSQKVCFDWKQDSLFNTINFLLEKVIRCAQLSVDCLMASKLVTLGYVTICSFPQIVVVWFFYMIIFIIYKVLWKLRPLNKTITYTIQLLAACLYYIHAQGSVDCLRVSKLVTLEVRRSKCVYNTGKG